MCAHNPPDFTPVISVTLPSVAPFVRSSRFFPSARKLGTLPRRLQVYRRSRSPVGGRKRTRGPTNYWGPGDDGTPGRDIKRERRKRHDDDDDDETWTIIKYSRKSSEIRYGVTEFMESVPPFELNGTRGRLFFASSSSLVQEQSFTYTTLQHTFIVKHGIRWFHSICDIKNGEEFINTFRFADDIVVHVEIKEELRDLVMKWSEILNGNYNIRIIIWTHK